jgi:hypothetical protein
LILLRQISEKSSFFTQSAGAAFLYIRRVLLTPAANGTVNPAHDSLSLMREAFQTRYPASAPSPPFEDFKKILQMAYSALL